MSNKIVINPYSNCVLASDIGGTNMRAALVDREGTILERETIPTNDHTGIDDGAKRLSGLFLKLAGKVEVAGFGVATAGPMYNDGTFVHPPNLPGWHGYSMRKKLEQILDNKVLFGHDATMAAYGEAHFGKNKGIQNLVYITISSGVGGGLLVNGKIVQGLSGTAGELGHIAVLPGNGRYCNVKCDGCMEAYICGPSIKRYALEAIKNGACTELSKYLTPENTIHTRDVFTCAKIGDKIAVGIIEQVIDYAAIGISSILNLLDPEIISLGGGVSESLRDWRPQLIDRIRKRAIPRFLTDKVPVYFTSLGDSAGLLGVSHYVFDYYHQSWSN